MNNTELRIGNWLQRLDGSKFQVTAKDFELIESVNDFLKPKPIELTPDILRNSGFTSSFTSDPQEPNASKVFELNEFKVHQQNENINEFEVYNFITHERIVVKGVHHLQNLYYFAFDTHQELNIIL